MPDSGQLSAGRTKNPDGGRSVRRPVADMHGDAYCTDSTILDYVSQNSDMGLFTCLELKEMVIQLHYSRSRRDFDSWRLNSSSMQFDHRVISRNTQRGKGSAFQTIFIDRLLGALLFGLALRIAQLFEIAVFVFQCDRSVFVQRFVIGFGARAKFLLFLRL